MCRDATTILKLSMALGMGLWAGAASAFETAILTPGATVQEVSSTVAAQGLALLRLSETRGGERSSYLLQGPRTAQLSFCRGRLTGVGEALPGGIGSFLAQAEAESRRGGLAVPHLSLMENGDEIVFVEWPTANGGRLTLTWTASAEGAMGGVFREWPCQPATNLPVASLQPPTQPSPAPVAAPGPAPAGATPAKPAVAKPVVAEAARPSAPLRLGPPDIVVALPENAADLAVNHLAELDGPALPGLSATDVTAGLGLAGAASQGDEAAPPVPAARGKGKAVPQPRPAPLPLPRSAAVKPKPGQVEARSALPRVTVGTPSNEAGGSAPPLVLFPGEPDLDQTNTTTSTPATSGQRLVTIPNTTPDDPAAASPAGEDATAPEPARAPEKKTAASRYRTPAECAAAYRSYDPRTGTFRTTAGVVKPCP